MQAQHPRHRRDDNDSSGGDQLALTLARYTAGHYNDPSAATPTTPDDAPMRLSTSPHSAAGRNLLTQTQQHHLVPYADWQVIRHDARSHHLVLWNNDERRAIVKRLRMDVVLSSKNRPPDATSSSTTTTTTGYAMPSRRQQRVSSENNSMNHMDGAVGDGINTAGSRDSHHHHNRSYMSHHHHHRRGYSSESDSDPYYYEELSADEEIGDGGGSPGGRRDSMGGGARGGMRDSVGGGGGATRACPSCGQPMPRVFRTFTRNDYFQFLQLEFTAPENAPATTSSRDTRQRDDAYLDETLSPKTLNQGYYDRFFVETRKLGRGHRGSVFLVQHVLDSVVLGEYACKSIPVGVSHRWLVRQLQEVHLLERLRHPNIIHYKHAWIENKQHSPFGPSVPSLFILMELANGGNLEEFIQIQAPRFEPVDPSSLSPAERSRRLEMLREQQQRARRMAAGSSTAHSGADEMAQSFGGIGVDPTTGQRVRYLTTQQIWSMFIDVCEGLAHLHKNGILHRDLKPPNLLLQFDDPRDPDEIPRVLLSDFGECEILPNSSPFMAPAPPSTTTVAAAQRTGATGTLEFMSPELLTRDPATGQYTSTHSRKSDMFSLGVLLFYLCHSRVPYSQTDDVDLLREEILSFDDGWWRDVVLAAATDQHQHHRVPDLLRTLMGHLVCRDPEQRWSIEQVLAMCPGRPSRRMNAPVMVPSPRRQRGLSLTTAVASEIGRTESRHDDDSISAATADGQVLADQLRRAMVPYSTPPSDMAVMHFRMTSDGSL